MPKIRDLGINVIPETMRPPEVGPGGGGWCQPGTINCPATSPITTTGYYYQQPQTAQTCLTTSPGQTGYMQQYWTPQTCLGTSPEGTGYVQQYQTPQTCLGGSPGGTGYVQQYRVPETCLTTSPGHPTTGYYQQLQTGQTCLTTSPGHGSGLPDCAVLTREAVQQLKAQLQKQIEQLDEYAKNLGPKTIEAINAREKELQEELEELARRRKEYKRTE
jgi:hypothetical protein